MEATAVVVAEVEEMATVVVAGGGGYGGGDRDQGGYRGGRFSGGGRGGGRFNDAPRQELTAPQWDLEQLPKFEKISIQNIQMLLPDLIETLNNLEKKMK